MESVIEFLKNEMQSVIVVVTFIIVVFFILGKKAGSIIARVFRGLFAGAAIAAVLHFVLHLNLETVGIIGLAVFVLSAIFGKIK